MRSCLGALVELAHGGGIARRQVGIVRVGADIGEDAPRARALLALARSFDTTPTPGTSGSVNAPSGGALAMSRAALVMEISARSTPSSARSIARVGDVDLGRRLEARADALGGPLELQRAGDDAAHVAHQLPLLGQLVVAPGLVELGERFEMHRAFAARIAREPRFLGRERQDRRQPGDERLKISSMTVSAARRFTLE